MAITSKYSSSTTAGPERPYEIVAADLRRRIAADEWAVDEALPTTVALAEHYQVSQSTITRVLRILAAEGLVRTVPRWGTFRAGADTLNG